MRIIKQTTALATIAAMAIAVGATSVEAVQPTTVVDSVTFPGMDPCTGTFQELTINFETSIHQHANNVVITLRLTDGNTTGGYELRAGNRTSVIGAENISDQLIEIWVHPDGRKFSAQIVATIDAESGQPRVLRVPPDTLRCIGGPTILPTAP